MKFLYTHKARILIVAVFASLGLSCEKVIDVSIEDQESIIVFEGVLKDRDSASYFNVSMTGGVYESTNFEKVSGATITVQDQNMVSYVFTEDPLSPGHYVNYNFNAQENSTYMLNASVNGHLITASTFSKKKPILDSIYAKPNFLDTEPPISNWVYYHSTDYVDETNYYRLRIWHNGNEPSQYYIGNDYYINGQTYEAQFFGVDTHPGDTAIVEMLEMDPDVYNYIYGLSNTLTTGPFSPAPANPPTNLNAEVEVQGYFGVYMTQIDTLIVP